MTVGYSKYSTIVPTGSTLVRLTAWVTKPSEPWGMTSSGLNARGARLGITPQSASDRARAGALRAELAAIPALTRLLARADAAQADRRTPEEDA